MRPRHLLLCLPLLVAACADTRAEAETPVAATVVDDAGREVRLERTPVRVVSLIPATTEMVQALGAGDRLAARTDYDHDPSLAHLPSVGQGLTPDLEWLLSIGTDLVVAWPDAQARSLVERLGTLGIPAYGASLDRLENVFRTIRHLGTLLDLEEAADSLVRSIESEFSEVRAAVADRERPRVLYLVWFDPPRTAGPGSFIDELIEIAGGENVFGDAAAAWPQVSVEAIVARDPDVIVLPYGESDASLHRVRAAPGWRDLRAVRDGRIYEVNADVFNRPGPRVGYLAREFARMLHPDLFEEETR